MTSGITLKEPKATLGAQHKWQCFSQEEEFILLCKSNMVRQADQRCCGNQRLWRVLEIVGYAERRLFLWLRGCLGLSWGSNSSCAMDYRQVRQTAQANSLPQNTSLSSDFSQPPFPFHFPFLPFVLIPKPYSICPYPFGLPDACRPHKRLPMSINGSPHSMLLIYSFIKWVIISYG